MISRVAQVFSGCQHRSGGSGLDRAAHRRRAYHRPPGGLAQILRGAQVSVASHHGNGAPMQDRQAAHKNGDSQSSPGGLAPNLRAAQIAYVSHRSLSGSAQDWRAR